MPRSVYGPEDLVAKEVAGGLKVDWVSRHARFAKIATQDTYRELLAKAMSPDDYLHGTAGPKKAIPAGTSIPLPDITSPAVVPAVKRPRLQQSLLDNFLVR